MPKSLGGWWGEVFNPDEQTLIAAQFEKYPPMGPAFDLAHLPTDPHALWTLATWFARKDLCGIRIRILNKALIESGTKGDPTDLHFIYNGLLESWYKLRDTYPTALGYSTDYCLKMIDIASQVAVAWKAEGVWPVAHRGFEQLAIIYDKQGRWAEAIAVCEQAKAQGWNGDWDKRIGRYRAKLAKAWRRQLGTR